MALLEVKNLRKKYGDFAAVDGIDFSVEAGEIFGFLGPNGAGKTTTINMLIGLARVTAGEIRLGDVDCVARVKDAQRRIGVVADESNLYDEMNGFDNLIFCGSLYGMEKRRRERRARELLEVFGLSEAGNKPFKAYSKGMKRKLTIAAGLLHEPEILFLDEPTTGLDVESVRQIRTLIWELNRTGVTVFLTTHHIEEAEKLCHRVAFIVKGKLVRMGMVEALLQEGQGQHVLEFRVEGKAPSLQQELTQMLPVQVDMPDEKTVRVLTSERVELMPFMSFFSKRGVMVYEAKWIKPSLEDVFVNITGIGLAQMRKEKEGAQR